MHRSPSFAPLLRISILVVATGLAAELPAQRAKPAAEWQKRATYIDHGVVPLGKHTLAELPIGDQWRLGMNEATTWTLGMPVVAMGTVVPPGQFRVSLVRDGDKAFSLWPQGTGHALGNGADVRVTGVLDKAEKPAAKLQLEWITKGEPGHAAPAKGKNAPNHDVMLMIRFGEHELAVPMKLVGGSTKNVSSWVLTSFTLPVTAVQARAKSPVVVATLAKKAPEGGCPEGFNLVVGKDEAKLVPWMKAPVDSFGFGEIVPPDAAWTTTGTATGAELAAGGGGTAAVAAGDAVLALKSAALQKGTFALEFTAGGDVLRVSVPEPRAGKK